MHLLKFIAGIFMIVVIYNVVFAGGMSLQQIGDSSAQVIQEAAETEVGQTIIERILSWTAEFVMIVRDAFLGTTADASKVPVPAGAGHLVYPVYAYLHGPYPCA